MGLDQSPKTKMRSEKKISNSPCFPLPSPRLATQVSVERRFLFFLASLPLLCRSNRRGPYASNPHTPGSKLEGTAAQAQNSQLEH